MSERDLTPYEQAQILRARNRQRLQSMIPDQPVDIEPRKQTFQQELNKTYKDRPSQSQTLVDFTRKMGERGRK